MKNKNVAMILIMWLNVLYAILECKEWCSNPCEELSGNAHEECGACKRDDAKILCFGDDLEDRRQGDKRDKTVQRYEHEQGKAYGEMDNVLFDPFEDTENIQDHCDLERVAMADISRSLLLKSEKPILIINATKGWSAHEKWTREVFLSEHGDKAFTVSPKGTVTLSQIMRSQKYHMGHVLSSKSCYSEPWRPYTPFLTSLHDDYNPPEALKPYATFQIGIGVGKGTGVPPEVHISSWFAVIIGPKRWAIHPPKMKEPPELMSRRRNGMCSAQKASKFTLFCTQKEGDIIWLPSFWWHETCNTQDHSVGMGALTDEDCCDGEDSAQECQQSSYEPGISFSVKDIDWCKTHECPTLYKGRPRKYEKDEL